MTIRLAKDIDLQSIYQIALESFSTPWAMSSFQEEFSNPKSKIKVAEIYGEIVGFVIYRIIADEAEILSIAVKPELRRKGVAKSLLTDVLIEIKQIVRSCFLEVRASNKEAIKLYEKLGFQQKGVRRKYYLNPEEDGILMELKFD